MLFDLSILAVLCAVAIMLAGDGFRRHKWEGRIFRLIQNIFQRLDNLSADFSAHQRETKELGGAVDDMRKSLETGIKNLQTAQDLNTGRLGHVESKIEDLAARIYSLVPATPPLRAEKPALPDPAAEQDMRATTDMDVALSPALLRDILPRAIRKGHMEVFGQEIVRLPSRKVFALELQAHLRVEPGVYLARHGYADIAAEMGVLIDMDDYLLTRAIDHYESGRYGHDVSYILHIALESLLYPGFLSTLNNAVRRNPAIARQFIFEIAQADLANVTPQVRETMASLSAMGCRFCVGSIINPKIDFAALRDASAVFMKLSSDRVRALESHPGGYDLMAHFLERLKTANMTLIVDDVDKKDDLYTLLEFHLPFAKGKALSSKERLSLFAQKERKAA